MIFTRSIKKTPIAPLVKNPVFRVAPVKFGYNMFDAVAKFSNCDSCNKVNWFCKWLIYKMFEHFRAWLKNPRIVKTIVLIIALIIFVIVLKHFGLYEAFSQQLEKFENSPVKIKH